MIPMDLTRFDWEWKHGDRALARELAKEYIFAHREQLAPHLENLTLEDMVKMIDMYREYGREDDRIIVDMWLLTYYDPQKISGAITIGSAAAAAAIAEHFKDNS